jgi:hypothetical protein
VSVPFPKMNLPGCSDKRCSHFKQLGHKTEPAGKLPHPSSATHSCGLWLALDGNGNACFVRCVSVLVLWCRVQFFYLSNNTVLVAGCCLPRLGSGQHGSHRTDASLVVNTSMCRDEVGSIIQIFVGCQVAM